MSISTKDGRVEKLIADTTRDFTGNAGSDIAVIFDALQTADPEVREALLSGGDRKFRTEFLHEIFSDEKFAFSKYCKDAEKGIYTEAYLGSILTIYENYTKNPPEDIRKDLNTLADKTAELLLHGIGGERRAS